MSRMPRLLPLVGVAIGGVVAVNALSGAHALPDLLSATKAAAEEALHPKGAKQSKAPEAGTAGAQTPNAASPMSASATPAPAPVCAPSATDLAKAAGLSPAELQVLQSLQARRGQIEDHAKDLDTEVQLLNAAEAKLDAKLQSMNGLKADIQALMGQADQKTQAEVDRLTVVYSKMKPADAAAVMAQLDDKVRLPIAAAMKPAVLSAILSKMGTMDAKVLTEKLAHRFAQVQSLANAANAPAAAPPAPAPDDPKAKPGAKTPAKDAKPASALDQAAAEAAADDAAGDAPDAKAKPAARKVPPRPKHLAKAAAKKPAAAKPKAAAEAKAGQAKPDGAALPAKPQAYDAASKDKAAPPAEKPG
jgi:flagellar motility protein MotE (MotC chaperone)